MITQEEFERRLQGSVEAGKITPQHADKEAERRRQWLASKQSEAFGAMAPPSGPVSFLQKAKNFAVATAQHVASGMPMASDEEIIRRHDICMTCEFFKNNSCSKCGCPVYRDKKFISKLAWADQSCPVGKWGPQKGQ